MTRSGIVNFLRENEQFQSPSSPPPPPSPSLPDARGKHAVITGRDLPPAPRLTLLSRAEVKRCSRLQLWKFDAVKIGSISGDIFAITGSNRFLSLIVIWHIREKNEKERFLVYTYRTRYLRGSKDHPRSRDRVRRGFHEWTRAYVASLRSLNERGTVTRHARYAQLKTPGIDWAQQWKRAWPGQHKYPNNIGKRREILLLWIWKSTPMLIWNKIKIWKKLKIFEYFE